MRKSIHIIIVFFLLAMACYSQDGSPFKFWQLTSYSGQVGLRDNFRTMKSSYDNTLVNKSSYDFLNGIFQIRTKSFFIHPNFCEVTLNGIYNPSSLRNTYVGAPDYSERTNTQGFDATALFLQKKNYKLVTNASMYNSILNIENLTRVKSKSKALGASFSFSNKILPINLSYNQQNEENTTIGSNYIFKAKIQTFNATTFKSFSTYDYSTLNYIYNNTASNQVDEGVFVPIMTHNYMDALSFSNSITDRSRRYTLGSSISSWSQQGSNYLNRLTGGESLSMQFPKKVSSHLSYSWGINKQDLNKVLDQRAEGDVIKQLYESLNGRLMFEHLQSKQNLYSQQTDRAGIDFHYSKKIPIGKLQLSYAYGKQNMSSKSPATSVSVFHEEYVLTSGQITLLKNQNIVFQSVVVKNASGIPYIINQDYILIDRNPFIEIDRVPGGNIPNGSSVFIDYTTMMPGAYKFSGNSNAFSANGTFLNGKLNVYYNFSNQKFYNISTSSDQVLNFYTRHMVGARVDLSSLKGGVEYEYNKSTVLPFHGMRYFVMYQNMYRGLYYSFNGNLSDLYMTDEIARRQDINLSAKASYLLWHKVNTSLDYMYRTIQGAGLYMYSQTSALSISVNIHKLFVSVGTDVYWYKSSKNIISYKGSYIQLTRSF